MRQPRKVVVIDDFYEDPDRIRDIALSALYTVKDSKHFARSSGYLSEGLFPMFEEVLGITIANDKNWKGLRKTSKKGTTNGMNFNGTFYKLSDAKTPDHIHHDCHDWVGVLMLSPECPAKYGTSLWEHIETQKSFTSDMHLKCDPPDPITKAAKKKDWREVDFIDYKYNRLVLYNGRLFHSLNVDRNVERINQLFCFNEE